MAARPHVELHCHLEGAIPREALWQLAHHHAPQLTRADFDAHLAFSDFPGFIRAWVWKQRFLADADDFTAAAQAVAASLHAQGTVHAELHLSPIDAIRPDLQLHDIVAAVRRGLDRVPLSTLLIIDLVRDFGPERAAMTLDELERVRGLGVAGIGLGGNERGHPARDFAGVFRTARARGWRVTAHAGETDGAGSVRDAVEQLGAERIGHGIRAVEDPAVLRLLAERGIICEVCPRSNLATGVIADATALPLQQLRAAGVRICINTDDPGLFGTTIADEFALLRAHHGWTADDELAAELAAVDACWLDADARARLRTQITAAHTTAIG